MALFCCFPIHIFALRIKFHWRLSALSQTELDFVCSSPLAQTDGWLALNGITFYLFLLAIANPFLSSNKSSIVGQHNNWFV